MQVVLLVKLIIIAVLSQDSQYGHVVNTDNEFVGI